MDMDWLQKLENVDQMSPRQQEKIAQQIQQWTKSVTKKHQANPTATSLKHHQTFHLLTNTSLDPVAIKHIEQFPCYEDPWNTFTHFPLQYTPRAYWFLRQWAHGTHWNSKCSWDRKDIAKSMIFLLSKSPDRLAWLKQNHPKTCSTCWREIQQVLLLLILEILVVQLKEIKTTMTLGLEQKHIDEKQYENLMQWLNHMTHKVSKLSKTTDRTLNVDEIETLFRFMNRLHNEFQWKYSTFVTQNETEALNNI